jgi:hypothetical protein
MMATRRDTAIILGSTAEERRQTVDPRVRKRTLALLAALIAVAFHFALDNLLTIKWHPPNHTVNHAEPPCVMVNHTPGGQSWEDEICQWAVLADPALLSLPNLKFGFSQFRSATHPVFFTDFPACKPAVEPMPETPQPALSMAPKPVSLQQQIPRAWPLTTVPQTAVTQQTLPASIIWRQADGSLLKHMPKMPEPEVNAALAETAPTAMTAIRINRSNGVVRVRLSQSCGNPALDAMALAAAGQNVARFEGFDRSFGKPEASLFFPPPEEPTDIQVEWRLRKPTPKPETELP